MMVSKTDEFSTTKNSNGGIFIFNPTTWQICEIGRNDPTDFTTNDNSSKCTTTIGRQENVKDEAEYMAREEEKRRKKEKEEEEERRRREKEKEEERTRREREKGEEEEERSRREKDAAGWAMNEPTAGPTSRSRLRIRAILEKQAKQRVSILGVFDL